MVERSKRIELRVTADELKKIHERIIIRKESKEL